MPPGGWFHRMQTGRLVPARHPAAQQRTCVRACVRACVRVCIPFPHLQFWREKTVLAGCRGLAVVTAALSVAVVAAEATISPALPNLSVFSRGLHALQGSQTWMEVFCCLSLVYPIAAAYYGLYKWASLRPSPFAFRPLHCAHFILIAALLPFGSCSW